MARKKKLESMPPHMDIMGVRFAVKVLHLGDESHGLTQWEEKQITLDSALKGESLPSTLFHEMIHAVFMATGIHELLDDDRKEENIVVALEQGLFHHLKTIVAITDEVTRQKPRKKDKTDGRDAKPDRPNDSAANAEGAGPGKGRKGARSNGNGQEAGRGEAKKRRRRDGRL